MNSKRSFRLPNRFDFSYHTEFNNQCDSYLSDDKAVYLELDFSQVNYLDSSALGMLVLLARKARSKSDDKIPIRGAKGAALDILNMANMHKLYDIT